MALKKVGDEVEDDEILAVISDLFGSQVVEIRAKKGCIIIGLSAIPLVNRGDVMVHIATFADSKKSRQPCPMGLIFEQDVLNA